MENNLKNIVEKIKIAELDPSKTYFLQICVETINAEALQQVSKILTEKFEEYGIKNIMLFTSLEDEVKFTEVANGKI